MILCAFWVQYHRIKMLVQKDALKKDCEVVHVLVFPKKDNTISLLNGLPHVKINNLYR